MKQLFTFLFCIGFAGVMQAQPIISNGFGFMALINGITYQKTGTLGTQNYAFVGGSNNGQRFYAAGVSAANTNTIYFINSTTGAFTDSMTMPSNTGDLSGLNEPNTVFEARGTALYRINTSAKTYDSIVIGKPNRIEERPGSKEVWVASDSMIYVVNYASGSMSSTTIDLSSNMYDNGDVRFTKGGSLAYKATGSNKKIFKINANTKAVMDSIDTTPFSAFAIEVSSDSSKIYATSGTSTHIYDIATKARIDSFVSNKQMMNLYRHPNRQELWVIHHFNDSLTVYNENTKASIASFGIGSSPFFLAFGQGGTAVNSIVHDLSTTKLYPNPANDVLYITSTATIDAVATLFDITGRECSSYVIDKLQAVINTTNLEKGIYILSIQHKNGNKENFRFVKE
jgi:hypothetical protein